MSSSNQWGQLGGFCIEILGILEKQLHWMHYAVNHNKLFLQYSSVISAPCHRDLAHQVQL